MQQVPLEATGQVLSCSVSLAGSSPLRRGYGDSDHPLDMEGYTINNLVKDIAELVRSAARVVLLSCGHVCAVCTFCS